MEIKKISLVLTKNFLKYFKGIFGQEDLTKLIRVFFWGGGGGGAGLDIKVCPIVRDE